MFLQVISGTVTLELMPLRTGMRVTKGWTTDCLGVLGREGATHREHLPLLDIVPDDWPHNLTPPPHPIPHPKIPPKTRNLPSPLCQSLCAMPNTAAMPTAIPEALCLPSQGPSLEHPPRPDPTRPFLSVWCTQPGPYNWRWLALHTEPPYVSVEQNGEWLGFSRCAVLWRHPLSREEFG